MRPLLLFAMLCAFTFSQSRADATPTPAINTLVWTNGFPKALAGGVDVSVDLGPAAGWTCTSVTMRVVDAATNKTLAEEDFEDPQGLVVAHTFTNLGNNIRVRVTVDATFECAGVFDPRQIQTFLGTNPAK